MKTTMSYKGYTGEVEYDAEAKTLYGHVIDFDDVITFESEDARAIEEEFHRSVDVYLDWCAERGKEPKKPYSGTLYVRTSPDVHRAAVVAAAREQKSLNAWLADVVAAAAGAARPEVSTATVTDRGGASAREAVGRIAEMVQAPPR